MSYQNGNASVINLYKGVAQKRTSATKPVDLVLKQSTTFRMLAAENQAGFWQRQDIKPILAKLTRIIELAEWEEDDDIAPSSPTVKRAHDIIKRILVGLYAKGGRIGKVSSPDIGVAPNGMIHFAWNSSGRVININVTGKNDSNSLIIFNAGSEPIRSVVSDGEVVDAVIELLSSKTV